MVVLFEQCLCAAPTELTEHILNSALIRQTVIESVLCGAVVHLSVCICPASFIHTTGQKFGKRDCYYYTLLQEGSSAR